MINASIYGACGSIGSELVNYFAKNYNNKKFLIHCFDNNEEKLFYLKKKFYSNKNITFSYLDIRNYQECLNSMKNISSVYHLAAMKHVEICEYNPIEAINTNVLGTQNLINAAKHNNVRRFIYTSTDKAVNPTNVMGTSKLMAEKLVTAANLNSSNTIFSTVRFGNVLGSTGSVIPLIKKQFFNNNNLTLTDNSMSRFIMTNNKAIELIIKCETLMKGGEVFIIKMDAVLIKDLIEVLSNELSIKYKKLSPKIKIIGKQSGEKLYEELMNDEELRRSYDIGEYIVVLPVFKEYFQKLYYKKIINKNNTINKIYNSLNSKYLKKITISSILKKANLI